MSIVLIQEVTFMDKIVPTFQQLSSDIDKLTKENVEQLLLIYCENDQQAVDFMVNVMKKKVTDKVWCFYGEESMTIVTLLV